MRVCAQDAESDGDGAQLGWPGAFAPNVVRQRLSQRRESPWTKLTTSQIHLRLFLYFLDGRCP